VREGRNNGDRAERRKGRGKGEEKGRERKGRIEGKEKREGEGRREDKSILPTMKSWIRHC